jgi:hypothetical protein
VQDREHRHRDLWVGSAVGLPAIGAASALAIWAVEAGKHHVGFWPHAGEIAGLVLIALGAFLAVAVVRGWWLPGGFKRPGLAAPVSVPSAIVNRAEWEALCDPAGPHRLVFRLHRRFGDQHAFRDFNAFRCIVTDPHEITTESDGTGIIRQYPPEFTDARPVRPGRYRSEWKGRASDGRWVDITSGEREVEAAPPLIVKILDDSQFENWKYIALIAALHIQVENTTDAPILIGGYAWTSPCDGEPQWDDHATGDEILSIKREIARRDETQQHGQPLRHYARIGPHQSISGWFLVPVTRKPRGGTPACTIIVSDSVGNEYRATLPARSPQVYDS